MKEFYSRKDEAVAQEVREAVINGEQVEWNTTYETFYGAGWAEWARDQVKDLDCKVEFSDPDKWYGYYRIVTITPNK